MGKGLYMYTAEGLDLSLECRRVLTLGDPEAFDRGLLNRCVRLCSEEADRRARDKKRRTGAEKLTRCMEEEEHACLYATLVERALRWEPGVGCRLPAIVDVNHSPLGYLPSGEKSLPRALAYRAGARAAWPDLDLRAIGLRGPIGWHQELKVLGGKLSAKQGVRVGRLRAAGFMVRVTCGLEESIKDVLKVMLGQV